MDYERQNPAFYALLVALVFMAVAAATVFAFRHVLGAG